MTLSANELRLLRLLGPEKASRARARALGSAPSKRELLQTLREAAAAGRLKSVFDEQLRVAQERGPAAVGRLTIAVCKLRREARGMTAAGANPAVSTAPKSEKLSPKARLLP